MSDTSTERLAEIREAVQREVTDSEAAGFPVAPTDWIEIRLKDVTGPLAALQIALKPHEPQTTANGVKVCPRCSMVAGTAVHAPCGEVQAITAALSQDTEEAKR